MSETYQHQPLDKAEPIVDPKDGRTTPYFQINQQILGKGLESAFTRLEATDAGLADAIADLVVVQANLQDNIDFVTDLAANIVIAQYAASGVGGVASYTPNGSGDVTIPHGYSSSWTAAGYVISTSRVIALPAGTTAFHVQFRSLDTTNLVVRLFDMAGAPITSGSYTILWRVWGGTTA